MRFYTNNKYVLWNNYKDVLCTKRTYTRSHFHAFYGEYKAVIDINTCELIEGNLPRKQLRLALAWAELHQDELKANWNLAMESELPFKIEPLK